MVWRLPNAPLVVAEQNQRTLGGVGCGGDGGMTRIAVHGVGRGRDGVCGGEVVMKVSGEPVMKFGGEGWSRDGGLCVVMMLVNGREGVAWNGDVDSEGEAAIVVERRDWVDVDVCCYLGSPATVADKPRRGARPDFERWEKECGNERAKLLWYFSGLLSEVVRSDLEQGRSYGRLQTRVKHTERARSIDIVTKDALQPWSLGGLVAAPSGSSRTALNNVSDFVFGVKVVSMLQVMAVHQTLVSFVHRTSIFSVLASMGTMLYLLQRYYSLSLKETCCSLPPEETGCSLPPEETSCSLPPEEACCSLPLEEAYC
ncbi:hypothetical protein Tco_1217701 [Tanacetum coccineum]